MIHPSTELRHIDAQLGYGVFATERLPRGTITYVWDPLEVEILPDDPRLAEPVLRDKIERYSYIDALGTRIVSWDHAKYVNHCCQCNTMSTAYGFEIAIRDIEAGEQITDEYGMFNMPEPMNLSCSPDPVSRSGESRRSRYSSGTHGMRRSWPPWTCSSSSSSRCGRSSTP